MKINFTNNLNFGKTVLNETRVRSTKDGMERVSFVKYDPKDKNDKQTINCIGLCWGSTPAEAEHIRRLSSNFERAGLDDEGLTETRFYGLEDSWGSPVAIAQITDRKKHGIKRTSIDYIQTAPDEKYMSPGKKYRGLGETLIAQILQQITGKTDIVELTSLEERFWGESGLFTKKPGDDMHPERYIEKDYFDKYIKHVESKASPKIFFWC